MSTAPLPAFWTDPYSDMVPKEPKEMARVNENNFIPFWSSNGFCISLTTSAVSRVGGINDIGFNLDYYIRFWNDSFYIFHLVEEPNNLFLWAYLSFSHFIDFTKV